VLKVLLKPNQSTCFSSYFIFKAVCTNLGYLSAVDPSLTVIALHDHPIPMIFRLSLVKFNWGSACSYKI